MNLINPIPQAKSNKEQNRNLRLYAMTIENYYEHFGVILRVAEINTEPEEIQFCVEIAVGCPIDKILKHKSGLAIALGATKNTIRIQAPIPGRCLIGISLPRVSREIPNSVEKLDTAIRKQEVQMENYLKKSVYFMIIAEKIAGPALCLTKKIYDK